LLKIQKSLLLGKDDEALAQTDQLTTSDPANADAWIAKGDILMGKDLPDEALNAYEKALDLVKETDNEPLFIEERHRAAFFRSLEKRGVLSNTGNTP
jgi:predicted Zn-dependent protease